MLSFGDVWLLIPIRLKIRRRPAMCTSIILCHRIQVRKLNVWLVTHFIHFMAWLKSAAFVYIVLFDLPLDEMRPGYSLLNLHPEGWFKLCFSLCLSIEFSFGNIDVWPESTCFFRPTCHKIRAKMQICIWFRIEYLIRYKWWIDNVLAWFMMLPVTSFNQFSQYLAKVMYVLISSTYAKSKVLNSLGIIYNCYAYALTWIVSMPSYCTSVD